MGGAGGAGSGGAGAGGSGAGGATGTGGSAGTGGAGGTGTGGATGAGGATGTGGTGGSGGGGATGTGGASGTGGSAGTGGAGGSGAGGASGTGGAGGGTCSAAATPAFNVCAGVRCDTPPADACVNSATLRHYDVAGICAGGACQYPFRDSACSGGCTGGICQGDACGAIMSCNMPAAPTCTDASTLSVPPVLGTCASNACSYTPAQISCSTGCLSGSCLRESDVTDKNLFDYTNTTSTAFALDAGNQPRFATCDLGTLHYRYRSAIGWRTVTVDSNLGSACEVAMTVDASNHARLAYRNATIGQVRYAEETAPETFSLDVPVFADGSSLGLTSTPSGDPLIGYVTGASVGARDLSVVTRSAGSWTPQMVAGHQQYPAIGGFTQVAVAADGTIHVVAGSNFHASGTLAADALYARGRRGTWDVHVIKTSLIGKHVLMLDAAGNPTVLARSLPVASSASYVDTLWTFDSAGATLIAEHAFGGVEQIGDVPPSLLANAFGETRIAYPKTGAAIHRLSWEIWAPLGGVASFVDAAVGSDRVPRYLVQSTTTTSKIYDLAEPICHPSCTLNECGPDGCGGNCGVCANCIGCGEDGHCAVFPSERITPLPGGGPGAAFAAAAILLPDGRLNVPADLQGLSPSLLGTTGSWATGPTVPGTLYSGAGQIYSVTPTGIVYRWDGASYHLVTNLGLPVSSFSADVDAAGQLHIAYVSPNPPPTQGTNAQSIYHVRVALDGTVGPTETVFSAAGISFHLSQPLVVAGAADVAHLFYAQSQFNVGTGNFDHESTRYAIFTGGRWTETLAPGSLYFSSGEVDAQGTLWVVMGAYANTSLFGYAIRTSDGTWTYPSFSGAAFTSQAAPASAFYKLPSGQIIAFGGFSGPSPTFYRLDTAARQWSTWFQPPTTLGKVWVFDAQGTLHLFGVESESGISHLRHWWLTPPP
jgi:hypothetical protein